MKAIILISAISFLCISVSATSYYVDPINGDINNDGSMSSPWSTIQDLIDNGKIQSNRPATYPHTVGNPLVPRNIGAPVQAGDTLYCRSGYQGSLFLQGYYNFNHIHIIGLPNQQVTFHSIRLMGSSHWTFDNITVTQEVEGTYGGNLFWLDTHSFHGGVHDVTIQNCNIYTKWNTYGWSATDWVNNASIGIISSYPVKNVKYYNNYIRNVVHGIQLIGDDALVEGNTIENFSGDGIRGIGNRLHFYYNIVMNCYDVDDNHDDLFQSYNLGSGTFDDCHVVGNILIGRNDPNQPAALRGEPQGIGMFDGFFENWVISNNIIAVNDWHGITLHGARNCTISNNTITKQDISHPNSPSIRIVAHNNGTASQNNIVTNNIYYNIIANQDGPLSNNIQLNTAAQYDEHFSDWQNNDFRLWSTSSLIDAGSAIGAPANDADKQARPQGVGFDIGAYEYCTSQDCALPACPPVLNLSGVQLVNQTYITGSSITSRHVIQNLAVVDYNAKTEIVLNVGFDVQLGSTLHAFIEGCVQ